MKIKGTNKKSATVNSKSYKVVVTNPKDITVKLVKVSPKVYNDNRVSAYTRLVP